MPQNQASSEFHAIGGVPENGVIACKVGDTVALAPLLSLTACSTLLNRKPPGSAAAISSNGFVADLAGVYLVSNAVTGVPGVRNFIIGAWPLSTFSLRVAPGNPNSALVSLTTLVQLMNDPRVSFNGYSRLIAALENGSLIGITGTLSSPAWSDWSNA